MDDEMLNPPPVPKWVGVGDEYRHPDGTIRFDNVKPNRRPFNWDSFFEFVFVLPILVVWAAALIAFCGFAGWAAWAAFCLFF